MSLSLQIPVLPPFAVILALVVGMALVVHRPYYGVVFAVILPVALPMRMMTFTRLPVPGAFINLYDVALFIGLIAIILDSHACRYRIRIRRLSLAMLALLAIGAAITTARYGWTYYTLRALRWSVTIPLYFIMADNMLRTEERRQVLFKALVLAVVAAQLQYVAVLRSTTRTLAVDDPLALRTTAFMMSRAEIWLLAGPYIVFGRIKRPVLQFAIGTLLVATMISSQHRSVAFAFAAAFVVQRCWFIRRRSTERFRVYLFGAVAVVLVGLAMLPLLQLGNVAKSYMTRISGTVNSVNDLSTEECRLVAGQIELRDFLNSNLILGMGLNYFQVYGDQDDPEDRQAGFGHLGYITYLSQLGVAGFFVFAIWFPWFVIRRAYWLYNYCDLQPCVSHMVLLAGSLFIFTVLQFAMTNSFLAPDIFAGLFAGFAANLYDERRLQNIPGCEMKASVLPADGIAELPQQFG